MFITTSIVVIKDFNVMALKKSAKKLEFSFLLVVDENWKQKISITPSLLSNQIIGKAQRRRHTSFHPQNVGTHIDAAV